jgi:hypothetical protein
MRYYVLPVPFFSVFYMFDLYDSTRHYKSTTPDWYISIKVTINIVTTHACHNLICSQSFVVNIKR